MILNVQNNGSILVCCQRENTPFACCRSFFDQPLRCPLGFCDTVDFGFIHNNLFGCAILTLGAIKQHKGFMIIMQHHEKNIQKK